VPAFHQRSDSAEHEKHVLRVFNFSKQFTFSIFFLSDDAAPRLVYRLFLIFQTALALSKKQNKKEKNMQE
jgi:hypothetical protein